MYNLKFDFSDLDKHDLLCEFHNLEQSMKKWSDHAREAYQEAWNYRKRKRLSLLSEMDARGWKIKMEQL